MKKNIFFAGALAISVLFSTNAWSQKNESDDNKKKDDRKTKEIIIRQKGDKDKKMTIVVDGENITVNGKPLSEFHDGDVSIIDRDIRRDSHNFLYAPGNRGDMELHVFGDEMDNAKPRAFLGVITEKASDGSGVKITSVVKGSAAEKAGLQKDDVITGVNDKKINSPEDLMDAVTSYKPDDNVKIDYLRADKKKDLKVKLGETKGRRRTFSFSPDLNQGGYNFTMPKMPRIPNNFYRYKFWSDSNPKLGVNVEDVANDGGAKILSVEDGSAADKAGLKKDDIITEVNGEKVNNVDEIKEQLSQAGDKESFNVKAKRNNSEMSFEIKIPKKLNSANL